MPRKILNVPGPAEIEIDVTKFKSLLRTKSTGRNRASSHKMQMKKADKQVRVFNGALVITLDPPYVSRVLLFSLSNPDYVPQAIVFELQNPPANATPEVLLGLDNFKDQQVFPNKNAISVTDTFRRRRAQWKFSILFVDIRSGKLSLIDPPIIHESGNNMPP